MGATMLRDVPADLLADLKDDLYIPADDTSQDAWLQRRIAGIWARFETYTGRPLALSSSWADNWGELVGTGTRVQPPLIARGGGATVFLRVFPVQQITRLSLNGSDMDAARLMFDGEDGKLLGLDGFASDLRSYLVSTRALVEYVAGWESVPRDLYEALLGALTPLWAARSQQQGGIGGGGISRINAVDVGDVEFSAANQFVDAAQRGTEAVNDPLLGPFATLLDPYVDWRSMIGGVYPTTVPLDAAAIAGDEATKPRP